VSWTMRSIPLQPLLPCRCSLGRSVVPNAV